MSKFLDIFWFFIRLGIFSFGGPNAHIRLMSTEIVKKKQWMTEDEFERLRLESKFMPGPTSTQLSIKLGYHLGGIIGMLLACIGFILPSCLLMTLIGLYYKELNDLTLFKPFIYGIKAAVIAILGFITLMYSVMYIKNLYLLSVFAVVFMGTLLNMNPIMLIFLSAASAFLMIYQSQNSKTNATQLLLLSQQLPLIPLLENSKLLMLFVKAGALMLGSGYILFAYLYLDLTETQLLPLDTLLDSIAFSLFVPGPMLAAAAFIGYQLSEWQGSLLACLGIIIPTMVYAIAGKILFKKLISGETWKKIFLSMTVASIGVLGAVTVKMGQQVITNYHMWIISILCFLLLMKWKKLNMLWLIILSANIGYLLLYFFPLQ